MKTLKYEPLRNREQEIRLVTLLPGSPDDALRLRLWPTVLPDPIDADDTRLKEAAAARDAARTEMLPTLPWPFQIVTTQEGAILFENRRTRDTWWTHPFTGSSFPHFQPRRAHFTVGVPVYEALSYVWGSPDNPEVAWIEQTGGIIENAAAKESSTDPVGNFASLPITRNLAAALRGLRLARQERTLWADAVCIDQSEDGPEKEAQLSRMAAIYSMAHSVILWLGPESPAEESHSALSTLSYIGRQIELDSSRLRPVRHPAASEPEWHSRFHELPYSQAVWDSIRRLLSREYFQRLWIVQEVLLADPSSSIVQCGSTQASLYHFERAIHCLAHKSGLPPDLRQRVKSLEDLFHCHRRNPNIVSVFRLLRLRQCSNPWDRVYGMLGIVEGFERHIRPNYRLPLAQVYTEAFMAVLDVADHASLLQECEMRDVEEGRPQQAGPNGTKGTTVAGLPSWVPNWTVARKTVPISSHGTFSGKSKPYVDYALSSSPGVLRITGRKFGTVRTVSTPAPETPLEAARHVAASWESDGLLEDKSAAYAGGGSLLDAFLAAICVGQLQHRWTYCQYDKEWWRREYLAKLHGDARNSFAQEDLSGHFHTMAAMVRSRTLVTTEDGYIGLGPPCAKPGDIICAILGCSSAIVLRPNGDGHHHQVVGECYVEGMDDAAGIIGPLPDGWWVRNAMTWTGAGTKRFVDGNEDEHARIDPAIVAMGTDDDPRLPALEYPWVTTVTKRGPGWVNLQTLETTYGDPRLRPEALRARGIELQTFSLV